MAAALAFHLPAASADETRSIRAATAAPRKCHEAALNGKPGAAGFEVTAPGAGLVRVRLNPVGGRDADWDLAVFDRSGGRAVAASAGLRSNELADGYVTAGQKLWVQGCRYGGAAETVSVAVSFVPVSTEDGREEPSQLVAVDTPDRAAKGRLGALDLDLTEAATGSTVDVVLHGKADAERLKAAGFTHTVKIPDVGARVREVRAADARYAADNPRSDLPSGRTSYRRLADYDYELKELARRYPTLARTFTLSRRSVEGRDIGGLEITTDPGNVRDGKPIFLNLGLHHAREWPAGEHVMEWAHDLLGGYGRDPRTTRLLGATRSIVVPVVNPDGFAVSREAGSDNGFVPPVHPTDKEKPEPPAGDPLRAANEMKRKNCAPNGGAGPCALNPDGPDRGVDLNRNYGSFWGGSGADLDPLREAYRGPAPFSEPESQAVRELIAGRAVTNLLTNHTYGNQILRPPGVHGNGMPVDEPLLKSLGGKLSAHNGYDSIYGWELYDTTGTTEDWSYWVTGGLGYTFEIGGTEFHPSFVDGVVAEYLGRAPAAGAGKGGNREAYFAMLESTADSAHHATLTGSAPPGHTLQVRKSFQTSTSPVLQPDGTNGAVRTFPETLTSTLAPNGRFSWALNPSTRPVVAGRYGRPATAPAQTAIPFANPPGDPGLNDGHPIEGPHEEFSFTVQGLPEADNDRAEIRIEWGDTRTEWNLYLFDPNGEIVNVAIADGTRVGVITMIHPAPGTYRAVIANRARVAGAPFDDWRGGVTFGGPTPSTPGVTESWTMTCRDRGGAVVAARQVVVSRGQSVELGDACRR
ncbi:peptidase M14 [Virgisporangium aliadipatigenens]|uniref:Peptidase M14 n=1 Tax=Virgisporangium aliadipatigenens TaxID=741659 RepID=A0A8J3YJ12_9ACTN|nr:peptidase M14 [Virgisporangium aliadipatigenens]